MPSQQQLPVQVSPKHKMLGVPYAEPVHNIFTSAQDIVSGGQRLLILPHQPRETFILRKMGYSVPAPILTHYEWPGSETPFDVQKKTCDLLTLNPRAYVLNGMGTGKTKAALWSWDYLRGNNLANKLLVVAPLSTLTFVWAREVFATLPHRSCAVVHGTKPRRLKMLEEDVDIYIINHDGVKTVRDVLDAKVKSGEISALILDELAVYRNSTTRTKHMRAFAEPIPWVWGMTGSPIPNSPTDAWGLASIITPRTIPKYFRQFRDDLMIKVSQFKFVPKKDAVERAYKVMQPAVRFTLNDVLELPDVVTRYVDVELGKQQKRVYKDIAAQCYAAVQNGEITAANAGAVMSKLLQISTGWVYTSTHDTIALDNNNRMTALMDAIASTDNKVLIFTPFKHSLAGIYDALVADGYDTAEAVSGDTPSNRRAEIFNIFQNTDKYRILPAHPQCLAHGITLTRADTIIWFGPVTSLEIYEQANYRIRRVGQNNKQLLWHLQATPVEKRIYDLLRDKRNIQGMLLELFEAASKE